MKKFATYSAVLAAAIMLSACHDHEHSLYAHMEPVGPVEGSTPGESPATAQQVDTRSNLAVYNVSEALGLAVLEGDFAGFTAAANELSFAGFSVIRNGLQANGSTVEDLAIAAAVAIRDDLSQSGLLRDIRQVTDSRYRTTAGEAAYYLQLSLQLNAGISVAELRNRILTIIGSDAGDVTAEALPVEFAVDSDDLSLLLTVIERDGQQVVIGGVVPATGFAAADEALADYFRGYAVVPADFTGRVGLDSFQQTVGASNAVDIVVVIDSSISMADEQVNLASGMNRFFDTLQSAGVNYRLAVARASRDGAACSELSQTTDGSRWIDPTTPNARVEWSGNGVDIPGIANPGIAGSPNETGLYCAVNALEDTNGTNAGFNREGVPDIVLIVSDEPDAELAFSARPDSAPSDYTLATLTDYQNYFSQNGVTMFMIGGEATDVSLGESDSSYYCQGDGGSAFGGAYYGDLVRTTGGSRASICAPNSQWEVMLSEVADAASGLASQFTLTDVPVPSSVTVLVDGVETLRDPSRQDGFEVFVDNNGASIVFHGNALPGDGSEIEVNYTYLAE